VPNAIDIDLWNRDGSAIDGFDPFTWLGNPDVPERVRQRRALTSARRDVRDVRLASDPRGHGRLAL